MAKIYRFDGTAALKQENRHFPDFQIVEYQEADFHTIDVDKAMKSIRGFSLCSSKKEFRFGVIAGILGLAALFVFSFAPWF